MKDHKHTIRKMFAPDFYGMPAGYCNAPRLRVPCLARAAFIIEWQRELKDGDSYSHREVCEAHGRAFAARHDLTFPDQLDLPLKKKDLSWDK